MSDPKCYKVFVRNWWRWGPPERPTGKQRLIPDPGARKTTLARGLTESEARAMCKEYARTHKPGALSRKAEYTIQ